MVKKKDIKVIIRNNNETQILSEAEAIKFAKNKFNPCINSRNIYYKERQEFNEEVFLQPYETPFNLKQFIEFLTKIYDKFGNMPVLCFDGKKQSFYVPVFANIDIVKNYFTTYWIESQEMCIDIHNSKALTFYHE